DSAIGRIIEAVEGRGIADNTLMVFISDNGAQQDWTAAENEYDNRHGPNDVLGDNRPLRNWKGSVYEGGIRVPAVFYQPGSLAPGTLNVPAHVMDLLPTFARLAGTQAPEAMEVEGIDLWPALAAKAIPAERTLYWNTGSQLAARRGNWKIVHPGDRVEEGNSELYDIAADPLEKKDRSAELLSLNAQMRQILARQRSLDRIEQ
ncbi:MAG TPA: sulfatase-like hydrolase/transferase, partial [Candidatus Glassbacteria bacterium]|nr:sulfatase-like hydrolase/transferase [Candidatus Glassbacteria bacterium]